MVYHDIMSLFAPGAGQVAGDSYPDLAIRYAFPTVLGLIVLYYVLTALSGYMTSRRQESRRQSEDARRRHIYQQRYSEQASAGSSEGTGPTNGEEKEESEPSSNSCSLPFRIAPRMPSSHGGSSFGSSPMTMGDLRSRITVPPRNSRTCTSGCG
ncbi:hypothetical protein GQ54DRAFT_196993 [Martensiomyces pterosporus]|nr:hypothetical protein GQ54DRAFT_196993 [Martensiomyces pterosporus]